MTMLETKINDLKSTDVEGVDNNYFIDIVSELYFYLPTRLRVDEIDIFSVENIYTKEIINWLELPVFDIILNWRDIIERIKNTSKEKILLSEAGHMLMIKSNNNIIITTSFNEIKVIANYNTFYDNIFRDINELEICISSKFPNIYRRFREDQ